MCAESKYVNIQRIRISKHIIETVTYDWVVFMPCCLQVIRVSKQTWQQNPKFVILLSAKYFPSPGSVKGKNPAAQLWSSRTSWEKGVAGWANTLSRQETSGFSCFSSPGVWFLIGLLPGCISGPAALLPAQSLHSTLATAAFLSPQLSFSPCSVFTLHVWVLMFLRTKPLPLS